MAQRRRKKQKILPPLYDPQMLHQLHNQVGKRLGKYPAHTPTHHAGVHQLLQRPPLRAPGGSH
jgi:hypothetical protein